MATRRDRRICLLATHRWETSEDLDEAMERCLCWRCATRYEHWPLIPPWIEAKVAAAWIEGARGG